MVSGLIPNIISVNPKLEKIELSHFICVKEHLISAVEIASECMQLFFYIAILLVLPLACINYIIIGYFCRICSSEYNDICDDRMCK